MNCALDMAGPTHLEQMFVIVIIASYDRHALNTVDFRIAILAVCQNKP